MTVFINWVNFLSWFRIFILDLFLVKMGIIFFSELLPKLPTSGVFEIDSALTRQPVSNAIDTSTVWQYADDESQWHNFQWYESRILEVSVVYTSPTENVVLVTIL